jgi:chemotaxis protein methyltransferase CheR
MSSLPESLLSQLSDHFSARMGWHFPRERWKDLEAGIAVAARELGIKDTLHCARELLTSNLTQRQIEALTQAFTVGETYFFRDPRSLAALEYHVLPELIQARRRNQRRLRIWSAGCCTGEEPYTIAILLDRLLPDIADWQITLLGTDVNARFLQKAAEGIFGDWSFRDAPSWLRDNYFRPVGRSRFAIVPRIRSMVNFAYLNLCEDVYPSLTNNTNAMDLILCRNVLMYFSTARAEHVIHNFHRSLIANGAFLVSAVETSVHIDRHFAALPFEGATVYRKRSEFDLAAAPLPASIATSMPQIHDDPAIPAPPAMETDRPQPETYAAHSSADAYVRALALFEQGNYVDAIAALVVPASLSTVSTSNASMSTGSISAAANDPVDLQSAILLARIHANLGDLTAARHWSEQAIAIDRTSAVGHYLQAIILQEQNDFAAAAAALQRVLYLQGDFVLAYFALGNLEQRQGRGSAATRHFANALNLLRRFDDNAILPYSDGMAAGQLRETIQSIVSADAA